MIQIHNTPETHQNKKPENLFKKVSFPSLFDIAQGVISTISSRFFSISFTIASFIFDP